MSDPVVAKKVKIVTDLAFDEDGNLLGVKCSGEEALRPEAAETMVPVRKVHIAEAMARLAEAQTSYMIEIAVKGGGIPKASPLQVAPAGFRLPEMRG